MEGMHSRGFRAIVFMDILQRVRSRCRWGIMNPGITFPAFSASLDEGLKDAGETQYINHARIFIVDDTEVILNVMRDYLKRRRFRVFAARNGLELVRRVQAVRPDLILLDIHMPGIGGLDVIRLIRVHSDPDIAVIPIIAVTALGDSDGRDSCLKAGANEHLYKPLRLNELEEIVKRLLPSHCHT